MKKKLLKIIYIFFILLLTFFLIFSFMIARIGHISWINLISIFLLFCTWNTQKKWRNIPVVMIVLIIITISLFELGSMNRIGTKDEKKYILNYLYEKYGIADFKIIDLKFENESPNLILEVYTFKWNKFKAILKDGNGYEFEVSGKNNGFNNITEIYDNYFIIKTVYEYNYQYNNNAYNISSYIGSGNSQRLYYYVNYENINKEDFDIAQELIHIQNIREKILSYNLINNIYINVRYQYKDDEEFRYNDGQVYLYKGDKLLSYYGDFIYNNANNDNFIYQITNNNASGIYENYFKSKDYNLGNSGILRNYDEYRIINNLFGVYVITDTEAHRISENLLATNFVYNDYIYFFIDIFNCNEQIVNYNIKVTDKNINITFNTKRNCDNLCGKIPILYLIPVIKNSISTDKDIDIDFQYLNEC